MPTLVPIDNDPFAVNLVPVEHDPFLEIGSGLDPGTGSPGLARVSGDLFDGPSWVERATEQSERDREAYARGGVREMLKNTEGTQELAGGFGGGGSIAGTTKVVAGNLAKTAFKTPPFYSAVEEAVADTKNTLAPAQQWLGTLRNTPGVKSEELEWLGVPDFLQNRQGNVSKQELLDHIANNNVEVQEVMKDARNVGTGINPTKFQSYTLPGGENYRELLLALPPKDSGISVKPMPDGGFRLWDNARNDYLRTSDGRVVPIFSSERQAQQVAAEQGLGGQQFRGSHWDEPNVLAHVRFDDRNIGGDKTLHMAEIQSDWHQKGRRLGYRSDEPSKFTLEGNGPWVVRDQNGDFVRDYNNAALARQHVAQANAGNLPPEFQQHILAKSHMPPDAPFKTTWPELALKRMIRYAAENGYDRISWDTGAINAERYDLSQQVSAIHWYPQGNRLAVIRKGDTLPTDLSMTATPDKLADLIGKEAAERLINAPVIGGAHILTGLDLKVGGEGMKGFYDRMLPAAANKLGKKYGAKVEQSNLYEGSPEAWEPFQRNDGQWGLRNRRDGYESSLTFPTKEAAGSELYAGKQSPVHFMKITPELRDQALHRGFPLFSESLPIPQFDAPKRQQDDNDMARGNRSFFRLIPVDHDPFVAQ